MVRLAAAHAAPVYLDVAATVDKAVALIEEAGSRDVDVLVFPEVFVPGFPYWINCYPPLIQAGLHVQYGQASVTVPGPEMDRVCVAARAAGVMVVIGVNEREGGTLYNTQVFISSSGQLLGKHRKLQPTFAERTVWGQGDASTLSTWQTDAGVVGGLVCWEHTMNLARHALIGQGEQIHAGSWPGLSTLAGFTETFDDQVEAMSRSHAITGQCFVVVASSPVTEQMLDTMTQALGPQEFLTTGGGWSAIIAPDTSYLANPHTGGEERLLVADGDLGQILGLKVFVDAVGHYSRRELLHLVVDASVKDAVVIAGGPDTGPSESAPPDSHEKPVP